MRLVEGEGNDGYEGFIKDLLEEISNVQGFTYELVLSVDNKYGVNSGGNWSGLVGMVQREVKHSICNKCLKWSFDRKLIL